MSRRRGIHEREAARQVLLLRDGLAAVAEWERENGDFTGAEMDEARRQVAKEMIAARGQADTER